VLKITCEMHHRIPMNNLEWSVHRSESLPDETHDLFRLVLSLLNRRRRLRLMLDYFFPYLGDPGSEPVCFDGNPVRLGGSVINVSGYCWDRRLRKYSIVDGGKGGIDVWGIPPLPIGGWTLSDVELRRFAYAVRRGFRPRNFEEALGFLRGPGTYSELLLRPPRSEHELYAIPDHW
jgi:hypothetical protein